MNESTEKKSRGSRKERLGIVVQAKMPKTVVVEVERLSQHPKYHKVIRKQRRYIAHDEKGIATLGARVRLIEASPVSKTKRWRVKEVLKSS